jgi:hypothetical protein
VQYQVLTIDVGCCSGTVPPERIAELCNEMHGKGYKLDKLYESARSQFGPFCPKRCAVAVFVRA